MKLKKLTAFILTGAMVFIMSTGCGSNSNTEVGASKTQQESTQTPESTEKEKAQQEETHKNTISGNMITVVSREDGSGTRGAFIELLGIQEKDADGNKIDHTTEEAVIANKTDVMLTNVAGDPYAIGYVSLGSLNDSVKALKVNGMEASADDIKSGDYTLQRPFNIVTKGELSEVAQDFLNYILSKEGQAVVEENGYIKVSDETESFTSIQAAGKIVVAGSSSVSPIMEKLKETYLTYNTNASIEIQQSDSSTGMQAAMDGTCDIGMVSRELKDTELDSLTPTVIAIDGIAVIVNKENAIEDLSADEIKAIFTGKKTSW